MIQLQRVSVVAIATAACLLGLTLANENRYPSKRPGNLKSPEGPSQQCRDDAGPPYEDDEGDAYYQNSKAVAVLNSSGICSSPVNAACEKKGVLAAHLDGPVDCGGRGWHCRIFDQPGWINPNFNDRNFALCNASDADERDDGGHCHGSDTDNTYGWWVRDHWHRGYSGRLVCCCNPAPGWPEGLKGLTNRCDFRRQIVPKELKTCRDANEDHPKPLGGFEGGCAAHENRVYKEPLEQNPDGCWVVRYFSDGFKKKCKSKKCKKRWCKKFKREDFCNAEAHCGWKPQKRVKRANKGKCKFLNSKGKT